jgi:hypothetical protein
VLALSPFQGYDPSSFFFYLFYPSNLLPKLKNKKLPYSSIVAIPTIIEVGFDYNQITHSRIVVSTIY